MATEQVSMTGLPKKWDKIISKLPEFKDTADAMSETELKQLIVNCEGNIANVEKEMEADMKLATAKEEVKDLSSGYKDARKVQAAKIQYALLLLENKGVAVGDQE